MNKNTSAKAAVWTGRIRDFQDSALSRKEWCQQHEIALSTFSYWIRKQQAETLEESSSEAPLFARLPSEQEIRVGTLTEQAPVTIFLSDNIRIEVGTCCPEKLMASLLHAIKGYA